MGQIGLSPPDKAFFNRGHDVIVILLHSNKTWFPLRNAPWVATTKWVRILASDSMRNDNVAVLVNPAVTELADIVVVTALYVLLWSCRHSNEEYVVASRRPG